MLPSFVSHPNEHELSGSSSGIFSIRSLAGKRMPLK